MVLVHGLASSPEAWIRLTNDVMETIPCYVNTIKSGKCSTRPICQFWKVVSKSMQSFNQSFNLVDSKRLPKRMPCSCWTWYGRHYCAALVSDADLTPANETMLTNRRVQQFKNDPLLNRASTFKDSKL